MPPLISLSVQGAREASGRFSRTARGLDKVLREELSLARGLLISMVKAEAPVQTGRLLKGISGRTLSNPTRTIVTSSAPYTKYVIGGTRPHMIYPRNARALSFTIGGRRVFASRVQHPGTKPNPFHERAFKKAGGLVQGVLRKIGARVVSELAGR